MNNPLFSIITITFNSERTIERTLLSVLNQAYKDYEYIIVDGASNDGTMDIIRRYEPLFDGRMKWKSEPDSGIYNAMNKGILRSCGEIIGIVNSDDWLADDALMLLANEMKEDSSVREMIITGEVLFHYANGETQLYPTSYERYEFFAKRYRMGLNHPATFVPRCIYDRVGIFDEQFQLYADADFIIRCYKSDIPVHFIHRVLSNMADGGASNIRSKRSLYDTILKYKKHAKSEGEYRKLVAKAYISWYMRALIPQWFVRWYRRRTNRK